MGLYLLKSKTNLPSAAVVVPAYEYAPDESPYILVVNSAFSSVSVTLNSTSFLFDEFTVNSGV